MTTSTESWQNWFSPSGADFINLGAVPQEIQSLSEQRQPPDPVTMAVIGGSLFSICREMDITLRNTSLSPIINIGKDFSCALFTADSRLVAQACNCPGHVGSMHYAVLACISSFAAEGIREGDVYLLNDPFRGGTHLPDITLITPIFHEGRLLMFAGNRAHHSDVGGTVPGSFPLSRELFQEGIRIPPVKFYEGGRRLEPVLRILLSNVRTPPEVEGDIEAQLASNQAGVNGVRRLLDKYGEEAVGEAILSYMELSEKSLRASLDLPQGTYVAEDWMDGDGTDPTPRKVKVAITVRDRNVYLDFSGTSPQARGPINSVFPTTASIVVCALLSLSDPTIMPNHGFYRPIYVKAPRGTLVNPVFPAPAVGFPDLCNRVFDIIMEALTPVLPERVIASTSGTTTNCFFGGTDPESGRPYVWYSINSQGGWGARAGADGWHNVCFIEANGWDIPVETIEYRYPWRVVAYRLRENSAGCGTFRGGEGNYLALTPRDHEVQFSINGDRAVTPPYGVFGGKPGSPARCTIHRRDGTRERVAPQMMKADGIRLSSGDVVVIEAPSGGGYGNPLERAIESIEADVADRLLSVERARSEYGVVIDEQTLKSDVPATRVLQARLRTRFQEVAPTLEPVNRVAYDLNAERGSSDDNE